MTSDGHSRPDYFYTHPENIRRGELDIRGEEFAHLTHVMRRNVSDEIDVVDGCGHVYRVTILSLNKRTAHCRIQSEQDGSGERRCALTLAVALLKNPSRFDMLVEKTTELGVARIVPLVTERTIARHGRMERWRKIAIGAMKQSRRSFLPQIGEAVSLAGFWGESPSAQLVIIAHQEAHVPLGSVLHALPASAIVCIGPEGGFTREEVDEATRRGFKAVSLGAARLRTETAAIVSVAAILGSVAKA